MQAGWQSGSEQSRGFGAPLATLPIPSFVEPVNACASASNTTASQNVEIGLRALPVQPTAAPALREAQVGTDLNRTPQNWLHTPQGINTKLLLPSNELTGISSHGWRKELSASALVGPSRQAHAAPDAADAQPGAAYDFIAPADKVKPLFKLSHTTAPLSLVVHRVGSSLVVDGTFHPEGTWKRNDSRTRDALLYAKFAHHSMTDDSFTNSERGKGTDAVVPRRNSGPLARAAAAGGEEARPTEHDARARDPRAAPTPAASPIEAELPQAPKQFLRTSVVRFANYSVLVGTDRPLVFQLDSEARATLQLCDITRAPSPLTGIDYYLDNLFASVPEMVLCIHENGVVKGYQRVATQDIPALPGLSFDPAIVASSARDVFAFLHEHCREEGGTYWLYRPAGASALHLYDISAVGNAESPVHERAREMFAFPVGMLCYRMAANLDPDSTAAKEQQRTLFRRANALLGDEDRVGLAARERIADTLLPVAPLTSQPAPSSPSHRHARSSKRTPASQSAAIAAQRSAGVARRAPSGPSSSPAPGTDTDAESDLAALEADYSEALHHLCIAIRGAFRGSRADDVHAQQRLRRLRRKAARCCLALAAAYRSHGRIGAALRVHELAARFVVERDDAEVACELRESAGDTLLVIHHIATQSASSNAVDVAKTTDTATAIDHLQIPPIHHALRLEFHRPVTLESERSLSDALALYARAAAASNSSRSSLRRLGNAHNEMGKYLMNAQRFTKARQAFDSAMRVFQQCGDSINEALVHCNIAKIYRIRGTMERSPDGVLSDAVREYEQALQLLANPSADETVPPALSQAIGRDFVSASIAQADTLSAHDQQRSIVKAEETANRLGIPSNLLIPLRLRQSSLDRDSSLSTAKTKPMRLKRAERIAREAVKSGGEYLVSSICELGRVVHCAFGPWKAIQEVVKVANEYQKIDDEILSELLSYCRSILSTSASLPCKKVMESILRVKSGDQDRWKDVVEVVQNHRKP